MMKMKRRKWRLDNVIATFMRLEKPKRKQVSRAFAPFNLFRYGRHLDPGPMAIRSEVLRGVYLRVPGAHFAKCAPGLEIRTDLQQEAQEFARPAPLRWIATLGKLARAFPRRC